MVTYYMLDSVVDVRYTVSNYILTGILQDSPYPHFANKKIT